MTDNKLPSESFSVRTPADAYFIFHKAATTIAYVCMVALTIRFFRGKLDLPFSAACVVVSGAWCVIARVKMAQFLQSYFDVFSRIELMVPTGLGLLLSVAALLGRHAVWPVHALAVFELLCWIGILVHYVRNKQKFEKQGYGPVPVGCWVSPPVEQMSAGDLILTNGAVARRLHESVGHAATVISKEDGLYAISSHMDRGCTLEPIAAVVGEVIGHYIVLKLAQPLSEEQTKALLTNASEMVQENKVWVDARNQAWQRWVESLHVNDRWKEKLRKAYRCTGYDWFGVLMGRIAKHNWTCIGASVEVYRRTGIHTNPYGTGLLGFGTTLFDPIMPVRFLNDPALRLLMKNSEQPEQIQLFNAD